MVLHLKLLDPISDHLGNDIFISMLPLFLFHPSLYKLVLFEKTFFIPIDGTGMNIGKTHLWIYSHLGDHILFQEEWKKVFQMTLTFRTTLLIFNY